MSRHTVLKNSCGHLEYELDSTGNYFIHLHLNKWSKELYKQYLKTFDTWLKTLPVKQVFVLIPDGDSKLYKFEQMFGFTEIFRGQGQVVMVKEIEHGY